MFLTLGGVFPDGVHEQDLMRLYRPRPGLPFTPYALADGTGRLVWTTFISSLASARASRRLPTGRSSAALG